jgi:hypothetical protein
MTTTNTNKFATKCNSCQGDIAPGAGVLIGRMVGGSRRWLYRHDDGACNTGPAMPTLRRPNVRKASGGMNSVRAIAAARPANSYVGMTWAEVLEANEHFDGEPEIADAAHRRWVAENAEAEMNADPALRIFIPYLDRRTNWGDVSSLPPSPPFSWS